MALLLTLRGSACLYQGEELGLPEPELAFDDLRDPYGIAFWPEFRGRDGSRTPIPWQENAPHAGFSSAERTWLPLPAEHRALAVDRQERDPASLLHSWRRFLRWRKSHPALVEGNLEILASPASVLAFERSRANERILAAFNFAPEPAHMPLPQGCRALAGHGFEARLSGQDLVLPGHGVFFGSFERRETP
jgi:alpha-glucosidase